MTTAAPSGIRAVWVGAVAERVYEGWPWWRQLRSSPTHHPRKLRSLELQVPVIGQAIDVVTNPERGGTGLGIDVTWPGEEPARAEFYGDEGPIDMFTTRGGRVTYTAVSWPNLFGVKLSPEWVRRFFGHGTWAACEIVEIRQITPNAIASLVNGFDVANQGGDGRPEWISFARVSDTTVALLLGHLDANHQLRPGRRLYGFMVTHSLQQFSPEFSVEWVSSFLGADRCSKNPE